MSWVELSEGGEYLSRLLSRPVTPSCPQTLPVTQIMSAKSSGAFELWRVTVGQRLAQWCGFYFAVFLGAANNMKRANGRLNRNK